MAKKRENRVHEQEKTDEQFDWSSFFVPDTEKILRTVLILLVTGGTFAAFVLLNSISYSSVSAALFDLKLFGIVLSCYMFGCYTSVRKISAIITVLLVLVPEVLIILYLLSKIN